MELVLEVQAKGAVLFTRVWQSVATLWRLFQQLLGKHARVFWGILILGLTLRVVGLPFGLPNLTRPDEQNISMFAVARIIASFVMGEPSLNPHFFEYPSFFIYQEVVLYTGYYIFGLLTGQFQNGMAFLYHYQDDYTVFHVLSRCLAAFYGVITIVGLYGLAVTLTRSRRVGLLSAFLLAITYLHVRDSHFGVTDVPMTAWVVFALWAAVGYYRTGRKAWLVSACVLSGLAGGIKYPGGLALISVLCAHALRWRELLPVEKHGRHYETELLQCIGMTALTFFATSPYILLDLPEFWRDYAIQRDHMIDGHFLDLGLGWGYHLTYSLWHGMGPVYLGFGFMSLWIALFRLERWNRAHWIPALYWLAAYAAIGNTKTVFIRYAIPLIPVLSLYAAWGIDRLARYVSLRLPGHLASARQRPIRTALIVTLLGLVSFHSIRMSLQFDWLLLQEDTRTQAREWFLTHTNRTEPVGIGLMLCHVDLPISYKKYFLDPMVDWSTGQPLSGRHFVPSPDGQVRLNPQLSARNELHISSYGNPAYMRRLGIRYFVIGQTPLVLFDVPDFELADIRKNQRAVARFSPLRPGGRLPAPQAYDQLDAFYLPFTDFADLERPGPDLTVYAVPAS